MLQDGYASARQRKLRGWHGGSGSYVFFSSFGFFHCFFLMVYCMFFCLGVIGVSSLWAVLSLGKMASGNDDFRESS